MDATLDHIRDVESKFVTDEEIYQLRRKITLPQARQPELVDIGNGFFGFFQLFSRGNFQTLSPTKSVANIYSKNCCTM